MAADLSVTASAPGKLFLLGEYAVLHGAPAVLAAVGARARVHLATAGDERWRLAAPGIGLPDLALATDGGPPADADAATLDALRVFDAARRVAAAELPPLHVAIDTAGFAADGAKLGIGASAAVTVALVGAFAHAAGADTERTTILTRAREAHYLAQGSEGSGADIAAAALGGLLDYAVDRPPRHLRWPDNLHALAVPTGRGADTRELVGATRRLAAERPARHRRCIAALTRQAELGAGALAAGNTVGFLTAADAYFDALAELGAAAGADIVTATHRRLRALAAEAGGVFKPTGAGGGDLGIVLTGCAAARERCARTLAAAGHPPAPLDFGADGLRVQCNKLR